MSDETERRRAGRLNARLWVKLAGVDTEAKLRRCNVSVTGVFFEVDREVGDPGSVQELHLGSMDKLHHVSVLARVVRVVSTNDIWRGNAVAAVAFDFMLTTPELRTRMESLVRYLFIAQQEEGREGEGIPVRAAQQVQFTYAARVNDGAAAMVQALNVNGMVLETSWPADIGETIRCEITAPNSKQTFSLEGQVVNTVTEPGPGGTPAYQVAVRFRQAEGATPEPGTGVGGVSISDAIDALLEEAVFQQVDTGFAMPNEHLRGLLSRIRLPSLLGFLEMERLTGVLNIIQGASHAKLYMRQGQVIDCDPHAAGLSKMAALTQLFRWEEGTFEFALGEIDRTDVIGLSTTHLLLKLTSEEEEAAR